MTDRPMVEQVDRLIGNLLAGGGELFLPGVGSLYTERQGAKKISRRCVLPPYRMVVFSSPQRGASLVDEIAGVLAAESGRDRTTESVPSEVHSSCGAGAAATVSSSETAADTASVLPVDSGGAASEASFRAQAEDIYDRWLGCALADGVLTVSGIGVLKCKHFTPDAAFDRRINPQGHEPVRIRFGRRFDWALFVGGLALLVAGIIGGYEFLMLTGEERPGTTGLTVPADTARVPDDGAWIDRALAGEGVEEVSDGTDRLADASAAALPTGKNRAGDTDAAEAAVGSPVERDASARSSSETDGSVSAGSVPPDAGFRAAAAPAPADLVPADLVSGRRYVVMGVFSTPENAVRAVRAASGKDSSLTYGIYRFGAKFMVSPFVSDHAEACLAFIHEQSGRFPGMWTYTAR